MEEENFSEEKFYKQKNFWLGAGTALVLFLIFSFGARAFEGRFFSGAFKETLLDVFGSNSGKPIYEVDLATGEGRDLLAQEELESISRRGRGEGAKTDNVSKNLASAQSLVSSKSNEGVVAGTSVAKKEDSGGKDLLMGEKSLSDPIAAEKRIETSARVCEFSAGGPLSGEADRRVSFNEIAWMGGLNSSSDEWIELKNNSGAEINLKGWQIKNQSEKIEVVFDSGDKISPLGGGSGGFVLLERTDDDSVAGVAADKIYVGAMSNESEWLKLFDADCNLVDEVNASWGWGNSGGENASKKTLERNLNDFAWHTSVASGGTPRAVNSIPVFVSGDLPSEDKDDGGSSDAQSSTPSNNPPAPQSPAAMKILISEVMAGSSVSIDDEFIEIYNYGVEAADLTGWTIKKKTSGGNESPLVATSRLSGKVVQPGKYLLLAHEGGYTGAVVPDVWWPKSYTLAHDTNNSITIYSALGGVVDQVTWAGIPKDKSYVRSSLDIGAGFGVVDTPSPQNGQ